MTVFAATAASLVNPAGDEPGSAGANVVGASRVAVAANLFEERFPERRSDRALELGVTLDELDELELEHPWLDHWAAWFGAGRANIRAWLAHRRPADRARLAVVGDPTIVAAVRNAVARLPDCFAAFIVANVWIRCSGIETRGWCHVPIRPPCPDPIDVLVTNDDERLVVHELMHAFQIERSRMFAGLDAAQLNNVKDGQRKTATEERAALEEAAEFAADSLARALGFDVDAIARAAQRRRAAIANRNSHHSPCAE